MLKQKGDEYNMRFIISFVCFVDQWLVCRGHLDFTGSKPHWKFIHLTNCGSRRNERGIWNVTYILHMKNGQTGYAREFSADEKSENISIIISHTCRPKPYWFLFTVLFPPRLLNPAYMQSHALLSDSKIITFKQNNELWKLNTCNYIWNENIMYYEKQLFIGDPAR